MKKRVLITNDDGFDSVGIRALVEAISPLADVTVVAPSLEKSACAHSLTLTRPLRFIKLDENFYKLDDATPSDCVYLSLHSLFVTPPDLVLSGINLGANLGEDITYSGTCGASMEAVLQGVPSVAFSQVLGECEVDWSLAKSFANELVEKILYKEFPLSARRFLNVNIPSTPTCKGVKVTKAGNREYGNDAHCYSDPRGKEHYWIGKPNLSWGGNIEQDCDISAVLDGYISVTPIKLDMSAYEEMEKLKQWIE